ncbi:MAG: hypothetical protein FJW81_07555 [Actinobacteria bacterium]|nr:hypothetical protein [Actinomycetota bacterium]
MSELLELPDGAGAVDPAAHGFACGAIRLAVVGAEGHPLDFSADPVRAAIAGALAPDPLDPFPADALRPFAPAALAALDAAVPGHPELDRLAPIWRPRLLALAGRQAELTGEEAVILRFEERLRELERGMGEAQAAGDEDRREALHAKYIEVGTTYAGRLAARGG